MATHGSPNTWGHFLMHKVMCGHHGDLPCPRATHVHHDVLAAVHGSTILYIYLRHLFTHGLQTLLATWRYPGLKDTEDSSSESR